MLKLNGNSLGKRQHHLNEKVQEAYAKRMTLEELGSDEQLGDVERIFKISLASRLRDISYIINTLKSGDNLYISTALKAIWMFEDGYSNIINPKNMQINIEPFMSEKMFAKFLNAAAAQIRGERAAEFYEFCIKTKRDNMAKKFLISTPEHYKLHIIEELGDDLMHLEGYSLRYFIGESFNLAERYLENCKTSADAPSTIHELRYLYFIGESKYLDLMESYCDDVPSNRFQGRNLKLGLRTSKHIITKHKLRVINNPKFYLNVLERKTLLRHTTASEARVFAKELLPATSREFWSRNVLKELNEFLDEIQPQEDKFIFTKSMFEKFYPETEFETSAAFYENELFSIMTGDEKEAWALTNLESGKEVLGSGKDYKWYKFINFDRSFEDLKKMIRITSDKDKRAEIIAVLACTPKTMEQLEQLLKYFKERHMNETINIKFKFLESFMNKFSVFEFNNACWVLFDELMYSLDVYNDKICQSFSLNRYRTITSIHHIMNNSEKVPEVLKSFMVKCGSFYHLQRCVEKFKPNNTTMIYNYVLQLLVNKIQLCETVQYTSEVQEELRSVIEDVLTLADTFNQEKGSLPALVLQFMGKDSHFNEEPKEPKVTIESLLRDLKKDVEVFDSTFPRVKDELKNVGFYFCSLTRINQLFKKLRVYFNEDLSKQWLGNFLALLEDPEAKPAQINAAINALILLADQDHKIKLMTELAPEDGKIDHAKIERNLLYKQEALCKFMGLSRPQIPPEVLMMYIKGDYVKYCLPIFGMYGANLLPADRFKFIESLLDKPVSIQKHGIRLAFKYCDLETMSAMVMKIWSATNNVSLRETLYTALFKKLPETGDDVELDKMFELLKSMTTEVHEEDGQLIFDCFTDGMIPEKYKPAYITLAWEVVSRLRDTIQNWNRRRKVVKSLAAHVEILNEYFIKGIVNVHIDQMLVEQKILCDKDKEEQDYNDALWELVGAYIADVQGDKAVKIKLVEQITTHYIALRDKFKYGTDIRPTVDLFELLLERIGDMSWNKYEACEQIKSFYEIVLRLIAHVPLYERYVITMNMRIRVIAQTVKVNASNGTEWKEVAVNFGKAVGDYIKTHVNKNEFYMSFIDTFVNSVNEFLKRLSREFHRCYNWESKFAIEVAKALFVTDMPQTYLVALKLVTRYKDLVGSDGKEVFEEIKKSKHDDVKALMWHLTKSSTYRLKFSE